MTKLVFSIFAILVFSILFVSGCAPAKKEEHKGHAETKKVLFYRNPMNPQITSQVPMKDEMGMDYIPVYENEVGKKGEISVSPEGQNLIGVKTEKVMFQYLHKEIRTVGNIAYDPDLYVAQQEYAGALELKDESLIEASKKRLEILGLSKKQIEELETPQPGLILPEDKIWAYITVYEYEMGLVKEGLPVEIEAVAYPGEKFAGKIIAVSAVLDPMTRSAKARAEINNPGHKLKPSMYVNVKIKVSLGNKLALPEEALMDTGKRKIVVVADGADKFISKDVIVGQKAEGYYEVIDGLKEGDVVVTSGNFLIDSESRLKSAAGAEHQH